jgi:hypothetical protein
MIQTQRTPHLWQRVELGTLWTAEAYDVMAPREGMIQSQRTPHLWQRVELGTLCTAEAYYV